MKKQLIIAAALAGALALPGLGFANLLDNQGDFWNKTSDTITVSGYEYTDGAIKSCDDNWTPVPTGGDYPADILLQGGHDGDECGTGGYNIAAFKFKTKDASYLICTKWEKTSSSNTHNIGINAQGGTDDVVLSGYNDGNKITVPKCLTADCAAEILKCAPTT